MTGSHKATPVFKSGVKPDAQRHSTWIAQIACLPILLGLLIGSSLAAAAIARPGTVPIQRWEKLTDTVFRNFSMENGLPGLMVTALAEDSQGLLWIGTSDGVASWDGYRFRLYRSDPQDPNTLPDGFIQNIFTDRHGGLWFGTLNRGLAYYDRAHDRFITIPIGPLGTSHKRVGPMADDGGDGLWAGTEDGLDRIDKSLRATDHLRHDPNDPGSLPHNHINALFRDSRGLLWVSTTTGLVRRGAQLRGNGGFEKIVLPTSNGNSPEVVNFIETSDHQIWLGTRKNGVFIFDPKSGLVRPIPDDEATGRPLSTDFIFSSAEARPGEVRLGTFGHGIVVVDTKTLAARRILHDPRSRSSLSDDNVRAMLRDRSGLVWVGTSRALGYHDPRSDAVLTLPHRDVASVLPMDDGSVWIGQQSNGVEFIDSTGANAGGFPSVDPTESASINKLTKSAVLALAPGADGAIYIGGSVGMFRSDVAGKKLLKHPLPKLGMDDEAVHVFLSDPTVLWIGSRNVGVWKLEIGPGSNDVPVRLPSSQGLSDQMVTVLAHAGEDYLWVGTRNGLNRAHVSTKEVEQILPIPGDQGSLSSSSVSTLLIDRQKRLWVGTNGGGINILEGRNAKGVLRFKRLGLKNGLPNLSVAKLLEDATGRIWASTDAGLIVIDPKTFAIQALLAADGVAVSNYWENSGAMNAEGELLFGGIGGMSVVRPERFRAWAYQPPVVVTDLKIGGKQRPASSVSGAKTDPLIIHPDGNSLAVEFAALDFSAPERNRYAYRLEGHDEDWTETDATRRLATYSDLAPGEYRLRLRGSNRNGTWSPHELVVPVRVLPAWYQTWWIRLLEALAAAAAIFALVQVRTRYLMDRQRELEKQVTQRTQELEVNQLQLIDKNQKLHEVQAELVGKNADLAHANVLQEEHQSELTRFLAVASHDLRQPMHALMLYLGALTNLEMSSAARPILGSVQRCAQIMDDMFLALLDLSRLDAQVVEPLIQRFPVATLLASIEIEFTLQAAEKGLELRVVPCSAWVESDTALIEQIVRNLVANAVRYTESGGILVGCRRRGDVLRLEVRDTGIGIPRDKQKSVFDEFSQVGNDGRDRTKGLGLGLAIVRRLSRLLSTPVTLVSELGKGSVFAIDLPRIDAPAANRENNLLPGGMEVANASANQLAGKLVVVVDDEESILHAMRILLEQWGCTVVAATSGAEAIQMLAVGPRVPDALVSDYHLRMGETALEVIDMLNDEFNQAIPALIITGTMTATRIQEMASTGIPMLHKPVTSVALRKALLKLVALKPN